MSYLDRVLQVKANFAPTAQIGGVSASPGWQTVGAYYNEETATVQLEVIGYCASSGLTLRARLVRSSDLSPIALSQTQSSSIAVARSLSKPFAVQATTIYLIEAECVGGVAPDDFGVIHSIVVRATATEVS